MIEVLDELYKRYGYKYVYLIRMGVFFVAIDVDAYILEYTLKLKKTKFRKNNYKVGFPVGSLRKYIDILIENKISFIIIDYVQDINLLSEYIKIDDKDYEVKYKFESECSGKINIDLNLENDDENIKKMFELKFGKYYNMKKLDELEEIVNGKRK